MNFLTFKYFPLAMLILFEAYPEFFVSIMVFLWAFEIPLCIRSFFSHWWYHLRPVSRVNTGVWLLFEGKRPLPHVSAQCVQSPKKGRATQPSKSLKRVTFLIWFSTGCMKFQNSSSHTTQIQPASLFGRLFVCADSEKLHGKVVESTTLLWQSVRRVGWCHL